MSLTRDELETAVRTLGPALLAASARVDWPQGSAEEAFQRLFRTLWRLGAHHGWGELRPHIMELLYFERISAAAAIQASDEPPRSRLYAFLLEALPQDQQSLEVSGPHLGEVELLEVALLTHPSEPAHADHWRQCRSCQGVGQALAAQLQAQRAAFEALGEVSAAEPPPVPDHLLRRVLLACQDRPRPGDRRGPRGMTEEPSPPPGPRPLEPGTVTADPLPVTPLPFRTRIKASSQPAPRREPSDEDWMRLILLVICGIVLLGVIIWWVLSSRLGSPAARLGSTSLGETDAPAQLSVQHHDGSASLLYARRAATDWWEFEVPLEATVQLWVIRPPDARNWTVQATCRKESGEPFPPGSSPSEAWQAVGHREDNELAVGGPWHLPQLGLTPNSRIECQLGLNEQRFRAVIRIKPDVRQSGPASPAGPPHSAGSFNARNPAESSRAD